MPRSKGMVIGFWIATALFCLQIGFTAYAQLRLPQVAEAFTHLGFPAYFRVELSWAKLLGVVLLLAPVPARLKEWAYAGFAITLGSALIAHLAVGDGAAGVGLGGGHRRALGALVLLLAPPAGQVLVVRRQALVRRSAERSRSTPARISRCRIDQAPGRPQHTGPCHTTTRVLTSGSRGETPAWTSPICSRSPSLVTPAGRS